jgi:hypothetical protein
MHHPVLTRWSRPLASLAFVLVIVLSACSLNLGGTSSTQEQGGGSGTPVQTQQTPTQQAQASTCQGLSGFGSAQTATAGSGFGDVSFPANSISTTIATSGGGSGRFTIKQFDVCTPATTTNGVYSFFSGSPTSGGLPGAGWSQATRYPYDGAWPASCGDPYCWKKDNKSRYVSLEKVTARGNGLVSYHMRLALPPAGPKCVSGLGIYSGKTWATYPNSVPDIYAPPFTLDGLGEGHDDTTSYGQYMNGECSAGSYTSVNSYFTSELAAHGWSHSTPSSTLASACHTTGTQWWKGSEIFSWFNDTSDNATAAANTAYWGFNWCHSK